MNNFDTIVAGALSIAQSEALDHKNTELYPIHLLWGLLKNPSSFTHRTLKDYKNLVKDKMKTLPSSKDKIDINNLRPNSKLSEWLTMASSHAIQNSRDEVSERDLLLYMPKIITDLDIDYKKLSQEFDEVDESEMPEYLINLNDLASEGKLDPVIGRTLEIRSVMEILGRRGKNNPVLVGPAGVGKTAIVEGLADAIVKGDVPEVLKDKTVYSLSMGALMAGTKFRGEFEERLQKLIKFIKEKEGQAILFVDEIHQLVGAGKTDGAMDAANLLKPALARGDLHCIGATTPDEYQKYILGDSALDRRFRSVTVNEPSTEDAIEILMGIREKLEIHHGIKISDDAIYNSVLLSVQYITNKNLPDKAIDLVDEAASAMKLAAEAMPSKLAELESEIRSKKIYAKVHDDKKNILKEIETLEKSFNEGKKVWEEEVLAMKMVTDLKNQLDKLKFELENAERNQEYERASQLKYSLIPELNTKLENLGSNWVLGENDIAQIISRSTGIPLEKILKSKQDHILKLESYLKSRVYGQDPALDEIADTLITSHAGLKDETKPLGSFLLKGPSGVGKTETAKALSSFLFDTEANLIRLDMSEFSEKHSVSKLIGAPAGYVGYDEGGVLTEAIRRQPYAVILFDEIEKAHHDFSDILLQILDDGRLTDNRGRTIDFKNTIILLTTNSQNIEVDFKPEVLGRLDGILSYAPLDKSIMKSLIDKEIKLLNQRLKNKKIDIILDDRCYAVLAERGYDERFGARPLASIFNKLITRPLAKQLLEGVLQEGSLKGSYIKDEGHPEEVIFNSYNHQES